MLDALLEGNDETLLEVPQILMTVHSPICNYCTFYVLYAQPDFKYLEAFTCLQCHGHGYLISTLISLHQPDLSPLL